MTDVLFLVRMRWIVACCVGMLATAGPAAAQAPPGSRVLVMPFTAEVDPAAADRTGAALWLGEAAAVLISEGLSAAGVVPILREERTAAFARLNVPMTPALTRATMIRIGELVGASDIVFGEVKLADRLEIRARLVRLPHGQQMPTVEGEGPLSEIFDAFGRLARQLSEQTGRPAPARPAPAPLGLDAFESYLKGLVATTPAVQQRFLEEAARQAPSDARILMALWHVYTAQGDHEHALASANAVTADAADFHRARFAVALSMIELRRLDGAWEVLTALHQVRPSAAVSSALGVVQMRRGGYAADQAPAVLFARAVTEDPENASHHFNLGYAHVRAGNAADALVSLREAVRFEAADGDAHLLMSLVLGAMGRPTEARREWELARLLGGTSPELRDDAAAVPEGLERVPSLLDLSSAHDTGGAVANPAQRDQQETAMFHLANGRALVEARRDRDAIGELRRAIYLAPYEDEPHLLLGQIYQRAGRLPDAIDEFTVALWCRETAVGRAALGAALLDSGEPEAARREAERAILLDPASPEARALLTRLGG